jgi:hypothetical protein
MKFIIRQLILSAAVSAAVVSSINGAPIVTISPDGKITITDELVAGGTDNVLFNTAVSNVSGTSVTGTFNAPGQHPTQVLFTSGDQLLISGGQATLNPLVGTTFDDLTFRVIDHTFTKASFNLDATAGANGSVLFDVLYIGGNGLLNNAVFSLTANGQNFFTIQSQGGAVMNSIHFDTVGTTLNDATQFRIGGAAAVVPDSGVTAGMIAVGIAMLFAAKRNILGC